MFYISSKGLKKMASDTRKDWALLILTFGSGLATGLIIYFGERQQRRMRKHTPHTHNSH